MGYHPVEIIRLTPKGGCQANFCVPLVMLGLREEAEVWHKLCHLQKKQGLKSSIGVVCVL